MGAFFYSHSKVRAWPNSTLLNLLLMHSRSKNFQKIRARKISWNQKSEIVRKKEKKNPWNWLISIGILILVHCVLCNSQCTWKLKNSANIYYISFSNESQKVQKVVIGATFLWTQSGKIQNERTFFPDFRPLWSWTTRDNLLLRAFEKYVLLAKTHLRIKHQFFWGCKL